jgi:hypothetical protein
VYRSIVTGDIVGGGTSRIESDYWYDEKPDRNRTRKPSGWLFPKAYKRNVQRWSVPSGVIHWIWPGSYDITESGPFNSIAIQDYQVLPRDQSQSDMAMLDALTKLKDQKVNLGVALAEARQTANLLGSTATRLARSYNAFSKGRWKQGASELGLSLKKAPRNWLELQYGWKPLMSDVYGSFSELARADPGGFAMTVKGIKKTVLNDEFMVVNNHRYDSRQVRSQMRGHFCRLDFLPSNMFFAALGRAGVTNPLEIIWEKVPFSFVADWFSTMGDCISVLDATEGFTFLSGSITDRRETLLGVYPSNTGTIRSDGEIRKCQFEGHYRSFHLERFPLTELPTMIRPRLKNPISLGHMANGLSLLTQVFSGSELLNTKFRI